jgi:hypothetical protein
VVKKDGGAYTEDDDINDYITNSIYENQIYAVRYNVKDNRSTGIIQVTDGAAEDNFKGASYCDIAFALDGEDFIAMAEKELSKVVYQDNAQNIYDMLKTQDGVIYVDYNGNETPLTENRYYVNKAGFEADILAESRTHGASGIDESLVGKYLLRDDGTYIDRLGRSYAISDLTNEQLSQVKEYIYYYSDYTITGTGIRVQASLTTDKDKAELVNLVFNPVPILQ